MGYQPQVIFDIGTSDRSWSKDSHEVFPPAEFHLFEPLIDYDPAYRAIIPKNIRLYPALGEKSCEVTMNIFPHLVVSSALDLSDPDATLSTLDCVLVNTRLELTPN